MNFGNLEYFTTIVTEGSISRAAEKLYIAQPSLSQYLQKLEKTLNTTLIRRDGRGLELTPEGKVFFDYACQALNLSAGM